MDTSKLSTAAAAAGSLSSSLSDRGGEVRSAADIPGGMWSGIDASAAGGLLSGQPPPLFDASSAFTRGQAALEDLVDGVDAAKEHLRGAQDLIAGTGITIDDDGKVTTPAADSPDVAERNAELARQAADIIEEALKMAEAADDAATGAFESAAGGVGDYLMDHFSPGISMDKDGAVGLGLGEGENIFGVTGPSLESGPFSLNSGNVGITDNPWPGVSLDRWPPKVSLPFVDVSAPNISVDLGEVGEGLSDAKDGLADLLNPFDGNPLDNLPFG
ncbi:MAG: hypothetical protein ACRDXX_15245 [Stackebrandtia sp.]